MAPLQRSTPPPPPPPPQAGQMQIQHFTHQHLVHKLFMAFEFNCDGCKTRGYGVRYRCSACNFDLHENCATAPYRLSSHVHPHHQIVLVNRPGTSHFCDVCKGFADGLSYICQTCEFDVHTLCTQIPCQQQGGSTTAFGGHHGQPVMINRQQQQGIPMTTAVGGQHGQPVMMNQQKQGVPMTTAVGGQHGQPVMMNQQQQGIPMTTVVGGQPVMMNQQQQGIPMTTVYGDYHGANNNKPVMINHQHYQQQQQGISTAAFGGFQKVNNNQAVMINHHQQQQQMAAFGGYHNQFGGYHTHPAMINQQQQQQQGKSNNLANVGKIAASVLMTSLIGVPINFNSRK